MDMTESERQMRETVIEFASCLYGGAWKERLAEVSGVPKRTVADWFRSGKPLPQALPLSMLRAMQNDAEAQIAEKQALREKVKALRMELMAPTVETTPVDAPRNAETALSAAVEETIAVANKIDDAELDIPALPAAVPASATRRLKGRRALRLVVSRNG